MLEHYAREYSPDLVLLAFLPGNDVRNNSRLLEPDHRRPFARLDQGELLVDVSFRDDPAEKRFREWTWTACKDQAIRRSRVVHLLYQTIEGWRARRSTTAASDHLKSEKNPAEDRSVNEALRGQTEEAGIDNAVFAPPGNEAWREAWQITDRVLAAMQEDTLAMGARFVVVVLNNSVEVHPDPEVTMSLARKLGATDLEEPQRRLSASGERHGFPVISLLARMRSIARKDHICFHGFPNTSLCTGHWNEEGHAIAGKLIAEDLAELLARH